MDMLEKATFSRNIFIRLDAVNSIYVPLGRFLSFSVYHMVSELK